MKKNKNTVELHAWFLTLWDEREDEYGDVMCFETGKKIPKYLRTNTCCYSHMLPKSKYPQYAMKEWNVMIVFPYNHNVYGNYPKKEGAEKQYALYLELIKKHENGELDS